MVKFAKLDKTENYTSPQGETSGHLSRGWYKIANVYFDIHSGIFYKKPDFEPGSVS